jgi:hypothetical protein
MSREMFLPVPDGSVVFVHPAHRVRSSVLRADYPPLPRPVASSDRAFPSQGYSLCPLVTTRQFWVPETGQASGRKILATMILFETRGLLLSWVIRGGIGLKLRLGARGTR